MGTGTWELGPFIDLARRGISLGTLWSVTGMTLPYLKRTMVITIVAAWELPSASGLIQVSPRDWTARIPIDENVNIVFFAGAPAPT